MLYEPESFLTCYRGKHFIVVPWEVGDDFFWVRVGRKKLPLRPGHPLVFSREIFALDPYLPAFPHLLRPPSPSAKISTALFFLGLGNGESCLPPPSLSTRSGKKNTLGLAREGVFDFTHLSDVFPIHAERSKYSGKQAFPSGSIPPRMPPSHPMTFECTTYVWYILARRPSIASANSYFVGCRHGSGGGKGTRSSFCTRKQGREGRSLPQVSLKRARDSRGVIQLFFFLFFIEEFATRSGRIKHSLAGKGVLEVNVFPVAQIS